MDGRKQVDRDSASIFAPAFRRAWEAQSQHRQGRIGWLRAAVLGANDGIVSTAGLLVGVAAAGAGPEGIALAGVAGLVAGAMSMAAGEYVSVHSQADGERAELELERRHLADDDAFEHEELAAIYVKRGLPPTLAREVADALMAHDALAAHARDELGIVEQQRARPLQAAAASAASFSLGAALPLGVAVAVSDQPIPAIVTCSLVALVGLGALAAGISGAPPLPAAIRVGFWGALAMAVTHLVGWMFGIAV